MNNLSVTVINHLRESAETPVAILRIGNGWETFGQQPDYSSEDAARLKYDLLLATAQLTHSDVLNTEAIRKAHDNLQAYQRQLATGSQSLAMRKADYAFALALTSNPTKDKDVERRKVAGIRRELREALAIAESDEDAFIRTKARALLIEHLIDPAEGTDV